MGTYTLPAASSGLSVTPFADSANPEARRLDLAWADNSNGEADQIIEASVNGGEWHEFARVGANTVSYSLTNLACGTTYQLRLVAENQSGLSDPSNTSSMTTDPCGWIVYGDASFDPSTQTVTLQSEKLEGDSETGGISGASILLAPGTYTVSVKLDLYTWDSYVPHDPEASYGTGFWDMFSITFTDQPYPQMGFVQDSSSAIYNDPDFPVPPASFWWGGTSFGNGTKEENHDTEQVSFNSPDKPVYLNLVLHADGVYPSWGTMRVATPTLVPYSKPTVSIGATVDQAVEGGTPGEVTFYRDTADASKPLDVKYTVNAGATQTVTIPAGSMFKTVSVSAPADGDPNHTDLTFVIVEDSNKTYTLHPTGNQAKVQMLSKRKYLFAFWGAGSTTAFGNRSVTRIVDDAKARHGYDVSLAFQQDHGNSALRALLERVDANADKTISRAEAEAVTLNVVGRSWGGIQSLNFSWHLNRAATEPLRLVGHWMEAPLKVNQLVTLDPVDDFWMFKRVRNAAVTGYVSTFTNFYQHVRANPSTIVLRDAAGNLVNPPRTESGKLLRFLKIKGDEIGTGGDQYQVEIDFPGLETNSYSDPFSPNAVTGEIMGAFINHSTLPWWSYDRTLDLLA